MFKLTDLFVAIKADITPLQQSINGLKTTLPEVAAQLGAQMSVAISTAFGPMGKLALAFYAVRKVLGETNEQVKEFDRQWKRSADAVTPVLENIVGWINRWTQAFIDLTIGSQAFQSIMYKALMAIDYVFQTINITLKRIPDGIRVL